MISEQNLPVFEADFPVDDELACGFDPDDLSSSGESWGEVVEPLVTPFTFWAVSEPTSTRESSSLIKQHDKKVKKGSIHELTTWFDTYIHLSEICGQNTVCSKKIVIL